MPRVLIPLARGFEEIEAVTVADVLRRGGATVTVAGLSGAGPVEGAHAITVQADADLAEAASEDWDLVVLPGGEPGTTHLAGDDRLKALLARHAKAGRPLAAICAAPRVLAAEGLLGDRKATSHPSVADRMRASGVRYSEAAVVRDGTFLTSRGPGTALDFALACLELLGLGSRAAELRTAMLVPPRN